MCSLPSLPASQNVYQTFHMMNYKVSKNMCSLLSLPASQNVYQAFHTMNYKVFSHVVSAVHYGVRLRVLQAPEVRGLHVPVVGQPAGLVYRHVLSALYSRGRNIQNHHHQGHLETGRLDRVSYKINIFLISVRKIK